MEDEMQLLMSYSEIVNNSGIYPYGNYVGGIYFLIDGDEIVYVGCCMYFRQRLMWHSRTEKKFDRWYLMKCRDNRVAELHEADFIWNMVPRYNKKGNPNYIMKQDVRKRKALFSRRYSLQNG